MKSYMIVLECYTGAKTTTWVEARNKESAERIATNRVNNRSPNNWKVISIDLGVKPDNVRDNWVR